MGEGNLQRLEKMDLFIKHMILLSFVQKNAI